MAALPVTLRFRHNPESIHTFQFDIAPYEEPRQLYRFGFESLLENDFVSLDMEFRGFSSETQQLVLQDNVVIPAGHIVHENIQRPVAGQIGMVNQYGVVILLVMQWRRRGAQDWEWYSADAVDWHTFRANVGEIFAHAVVLAQVNVLEYGGWRDLFRDRVPQDVRLSFQTFGSHVVDEVTVTEAEMQMLDGPSELYSFTSGAVFGMAANPVNFRGILGRENDNGPVNVDLQVVPNQTVGGRLSGELGLLGVEGVVIGQLRINARGQLLLLVIKWRAAGSCWHFYKPRVHPWEEFRGAVREIFAYSVLVAQF